MPIRRRCYRDLNSERTPIREIAKRLSAEERRRVTEREVRDVLRVAMRKLQRRARRNGALFQLMQEAERARDASDRESAGAFHFVDRVEVGRAA